MMKKFAQILLVALAFGLMAPGAKALGSDDARLRGLSEAPVCFEENRGQADGAARFIARSHDCVALISPAEATLIFQAENAAPRTVRLSLVGANPAAKISGLDPLPGSANYILGNDAAQWHAGVPLFARVGLDEIYPGIRLIYYPGATAQLEYDFLVQPGADPGKISFCITGADKLRVDRDGNLVLKIGRDEIRQHKPVIYQTARGERTEIRGDWRVAGKTTAAFSLGDYDHSLPLVIDPVLSFSTYIGGRFGDRGWDVTTDPAGNVYVCGDTFSPDLRTNFPAVPCLNYGNGATGQTNSGSNGTREFGDAFVAKFAPTSSNTLSLTYLTYLGGKGQDAALGVAADSAGNAYVTGFTDSTNFPIVPTNAAFTKISGHNNNASALYRVDAFIAKIGPAGSNLIYSTYLGGEDRDSGNAIAVDQYGYAYVGGFTVSTNFPIVTNGTQVVRNKFGGVVDGFVAKIGLAGTNVVYSTYLGGTNQDSVTSIKVDAAGCAYVTGYTLSTNFPTFPTNNSHLNGLTNHQSIVYYDGFFSKISADGGSLLYSTFIGGAHNDIGMRLALLGSNDVFITGYTTSSNFPVSTTITNTRTWSNPFTNSNPDIFLTRLTQMFDGTNFIYTTNAPGYAVAFGGRSADEATGLAVDSAGDAFITGYTSSTNLFNIYINTNYYVFKTNNGVIKTNFISLTNYDTARNILDSSSRTTNKYNFNTNNVFVAVVSPDASSFKYAALFGGARNDIAYGLAIDSAANTYIVGNTTSSNFPTVYSLESRPAFLRNSNDVFLAMIPLGSILPPSAQTALSLKSAAAPGEPTLFITQSNGSISLTWPDAAANFILESNTTLSPDGWQPVSQPPVSAGGWQSITLPAANASEFFRLRAP